MPDMNHLELFAQDRGAYYKILNQNIKWRRSRSYHGWKNGADESLLDVSPSEKEEDIGEYLYSMLTLKMETSRKSRFHSELVSFHQLIKVNAAAVHNRPHLGKLYWTSCPLALGLIQVSSWGTQADFKCKAGHYSSSITYRIFSRNEKLQTKLFLVDHVFCMFRWRKKLNPESYMEALWNASCNYG